MRKWLLTLMALLSLIIISRAHPVAAANATGTLTIEKRVSADSNATTTQQTKPLAGARYQLTRVQPTGPSAIDATKPASYHTLTGANALNVTLITDANGEAQLAGLVIGADYILTELTGSGVPKPAAPVLLRFSAQRTSYIYTPKSGLVTTAPETKPVPNEPIGNGTKANPKTILQTGGVMTHPLGWLIGLMAGVLAVAMLGVASLRWRRHVID